MDINDVDAASNKAFRSDLNNYLNSQAEAEHRAELAEELARLFMKEGEDYHPWMFENFEEALANASISDRKLFWSCVVTAVNAKLSDPVKNHLALESMRQMIGSYWYAVALAEATKRVNRTW